MSRGVLSHFITKNRPVVVIVPLTKQNEFSSEHSGRQNEIGASIILFLRTIFCFIGAEDADALVKLDVDVNVLVLPEGNTVLGSRGGAKP